MAITTKTFTTLVSDAATAVQGAAAVLVDMSIGSVLRAFIEAQAALALWLQGVALQIAALTRFATSSGADADTWGADFAFTRLPARAATGQVTLARFTPTTAATVLVGLIVQTADGTQKYAVVADVTQPTYSATAGGYVLGAGVSSASVTVLASTAGAAGNAAAATINTLGSSIPGVDTVTNAAGFNSGADAETDSAYRVRFVAYIAALAKATPAAVGNAVNSVQPGVSYSITENYTYAGAYQPGFFYVVADDGSGAPPGSFLTLVANAVEAVRPIGSTYAVFTPTLVLANVVMTLTTAPGYLHATLVTAVSAALTAYINSLSVGAAMSFTRLSGIAYATSPGVTNVTALTLNGGTSDLAATPKQVIRAGTMTLV